MKRDEPVPVPETVVKNVEGSAPEKKQIEEKDEIKSITEELPFPVEKIRPIRLIELFFVCSIIVVILYVYVKVYKNPMPKFLLRILGLDDTLYPEQYNEFLRRKAQKEN